MKKVYLLLHGQPIFLYCLLNHVVLVRFANVFHSTTTSSLPMQRVCLLVEKSLYTHITKYLYIFITGSDSKGGKSLRPIPEFQQGTCTVGKAPFSYWVLSSSRIQRCTTLNIV
jgi:hypothetical protein